MDKHSYKQFSCPIHPSETIQRVYIGDDEPSSLRCIECILTTSARITKDNLLTFNDFIEKAVEYHEKLNSTSNLSSSAPSELVEFLSSEEEFMLKLTEHIENEKQKATGAINTLLQEFAVICHDKKEEMHKILDRQLSNMKTNFSYYKSKYYNSESSDDNLDRNKIYQKINDCDQISDLEVFVKNLKDDLMEAKTFKDPKLAQKEIQENLTELAGQIKKNMSELPTLKMCEDASFKEDLDKFKTSTAKMFENMSEVLLDINEITLTNALAVDSKIVTKNEQKKILKKLIKENGTIKLKLLYRGSRDGFDSASFHAKCDMAKDTVTLIRSSHKKIFGGYTDQIWQNSGNYKYSQKAFLFSIDEKAKFPIQTARYNHSTYCNNGYGPTFGGGHDIYIPNNCNVAQCYSNLGHTYDAGTYAAQKQSVLAGAYNFQVEEIEVFQITESATVASYPQSKIANGTDFAALKGWIAPGKTVDFELIHKGTKDGFDAISFHTNCDQKGACVVICKSNYNKVFGGYTSKGWVQNEDFSKDKNAFLFSMTEKKKLEILNGGDCATFGSIEAGPIFGAGYDLFICSNSNILEASSSALGISYSSSGVKGDASTYLAGNTKFMLEEIEVYRVIVS